MEVAAVRDKKEQETRGGGGTEEIHDLGFSMGGEKLTR